jgi:putative transposase
MSQWKVTPDVKIYFVTTTVVDWSHIFIADRYFEILIESLKYCMQHKCLHLHGYVIMPNHAHYILSGDDGTNLSDIMRDFGTHTSREIRRSLSSDGRREMLQLFRTAALESGRGNEYKVWQEGFHPIGIDSEGFFRQKLEYVHNNPVRKGYVEQPEHWKYSSARNYILDDHSIINVEMLD